MMAERSAVPSVARSATRGTEVERSPDGAIGRGRPDPSVLIELGPRPKTARRSAPGFRSAARAARRPRSGRGWGRGTRLPAAPGSGFRSAARAARRPRSGRGWGRGTRLPAAPGSGFRSAARAARRPRSGRGWGRGTRLPAAPGSGIETPLRAVGGARRRVPIRLIPLVKGGNPLSHFPPKSPAANRRLAAICSCAQSAMRRPS